MNCTILPHHQLRYYLAHVGPAGVFSRYVVSKQGDGQSLAALHGTHVVGTAVAGRTFGLNEAYPHWVFADTPDAAAALAHALNGDDLAINFPLVYFDTFQTLYPQRAISIDCLYLLPAARFRPAAERYPVRKLSVADLKDLIIPGELWPLLGSPQRWQDDMELYGVVDEGQLVCMAETTVRDRHIAVIQQLYTIISRRGRQLAQCLVSAMAQQLIADRKVPMYVADEANTPSRNIAEKLGFELDSRWGYIG